MSGGDLVRPKKMHSLAPVQVCLRLSEVTEERPHFFFRKSGSSCVCRPDTLGCERGHAKHGGEHRCRHENGGRLCGDVGASMKICKANVSDGHGCKKKCGCGYQDHAMMVRIEMWMMMDCQFAQQRTQGGQPSGPWSSMGSSRVHGRQETEVRGHQAVVGCSRKTQSMPRSGTRMSPRTQPSPP